MLVFFCTCSVTTGMAPRNFTHGLESISTKSRLLSVGGSSLGYYNRFSLLRSVFLTTTIDRASSMDEVVPRLWIGDLPSALDVETLKAEKIFSVVTAMRGKVTIHAVRRPRCQTN